jgi:hypothetical protein
MVRHHVGDIAWSARWIFDQVGGKKHLASTTVTNGKSLERRANAQPAS